MGRFTGQVTQYHPLASEWTGMEWTRVLRSPRCFCFNDEDAPSCGVHALDTIPAEYAVTVEVQADQLVLHIVLPVARAALVAE